MEAKNPWLFPELRTFECPYCGTVFANTESELSARPWICTRCRGVSCYAPCADSGLPPQNKKYPVKLLKFHRHRGAPAVFLLTFISSHANFQLHIEIRNEGEQNMHLEILLAVIFACYIGMKIYFHKRVMRIINILNIDICDLNGAADRESFLELAKNCYDREVRLAKWRLYRYLKDNETTGQILNRAEKLLADPNCNWRVLRSRRFKPGKKFFSLVTESGDISIGAPKEKCIGRGNRNVDEVMKFKNIPPELLDAFWQLRYENLFHGE